MAQDGSNMAPRSAQDGTRTAQDVSKMAQDDSKMAKIAPRWLQYDSKIAQDGPNKAQDGPKLALRWTKIAQDGLKKQATKRPTNFQPTFAKHRPSLTLFASTYDSPPDKLNGFPNCFSPLPLRYSKHLITKRGRRHGRSLQN